jgi:hypothetical protein
MPKQVQDLLDIINAADTVIDGATAFANGVPALLAAAAAEALKLGATAAQLQPLTDLSKVMQSKATALATALVTNTPAAPAA